MKIHKTLVEAAIEASFKILAENNHAGYIIKNTLASNKKWGSRDRKFIAETSLDVVRYFIYYKNLCEVEGTIIDDFATLVSCSILLNHEELPEFLEEYLDRSKIEANKDKYKANRAIKESYPTWMDELLSNDLGEEKWNIEAIASNQLTVPVLRVNTLKTTFIKAKNILEKEEVKLDEAANLPNALVLQKRRDVRQTKAYKEGWIEVQDAGSQYIAPFLDLKPGETFIDACAGAGGKTLHAAALMENKGRIISMDVHQNKLDELQERAKRAGARIINTQLISEQTLNKFQNHADKLLLDVPCSGLGVLRRNPDDKWKLNIGRINELIALQAKILQDYSKMLKSGGTMVYATCSIYSEENQKQVQQFLSNNSDFKLDEEKQLFPSDGFDGFYMARLIKG